MNAVKDISQLGRVAPQAIALEDAVLGAMMIDKDAITVILDILKPESFYLKKHQLIFESMIQLFEKSKPIDLLTVSEECKAMGVIDEIGGPYYLVELTNRIASAANLEAHARIVAQKAMRRELIGLANSLNQNAYDDTFDIFDLKEQAEQGIFQISQDSAKGAVPFDRGMVELRKKLEKASNSPDGVTGVPTGFTGLDNLTNGWQKTDLIILAARPGMGKTSFILSLAKNAAYEHKKGVAIFSLEMSIVQLVQRMVSQDAQISGHAMNSGQLDPHEWQQLQTSMERLSELPVYIDDTPGLSIYEMRAKSRKLKMQHDIQLVVVDYLQLMTGPKNGGKGNREQEVSAISRGLKAMAKELDVPVIALSQLSRAVEVRGGTKRPQLSDLRESGSLEQDADQVGFIYRPEYYDILEDEEGQSLKGVGEIIFAKNRHGNQGTVKLRWDAQYTLFRDPEDDDFAGLDNSPEYDQPPPDRIASRPTPGEDDDIPF